MEKELLDLLDVDFPSVRPVTEETRKEIVQRAHRFRGSVRIMSGRIWTDQEFEERRKNVLAKPLP